MQLPSIGHLFYRPQRSWAKVIFLQACVCPQGGWGVWWVSQQHAMQVSPRGGLVPGGLQFFGGRGSNFSGGWSPIFSGGVSNFSGGKGGPQFFWGGILFHFCFLWGYTPPPRSRVKYMVNERPVRILLECILVMTYYYRMGGHGLLVRPLPRSATS